MPVLTPDAEISLILERKQLQALERRGFDPQAFARRNDLIEYSPLRRLALTVLAGGLGLTGRAQDAAALRSHLAFMSATHQGAGRLPTLIREQAKRFPPPTSPYQRQDDHLLLCEVRQDIENALRRLKPGHPLRALETVLAATQMATAPIGRCNALIFTNRARDRFGMLIDDETGRVITQMGFLFARLVSQAERGMGLDTALAVDRLRTKGVGATFATMVDAFVSHGSSRYGAAPPPPSAFQIDVMASFAKLGWIFVVAHELAHAALGHLERFEIEFAMLEEDAPSSEDPAPRLEAEFAADAFALQLTDMIARQWGCAPGLAAPAAIMVLAMYENVYDEVAARSRSGAFRARRDEVARQLYHHPPPGDRIHRMLDLQEPLHVWAWHVAETLRSASPCRTSHDTAPAERWREFEARLSAAA